jgi:hypothetical protein
MRLYQSLGDLPLGGPRRVVAIGAFDGVHLGHQAIIGQAIEEARSRGSLPPLSPEEARERFGLEELSEGARNRFRAVLARFARHEISSGRAAELLGISKPEFLLRASADAVPVVDLDDEELDEEFRRG